MMVRLLTSLHMQTNSDSFSAFLHGKSLVEFVKAEVEPMDAYSEMPQVVALSNEMGYTTTSSLMIIWQYFSTDN